VTLKKAGLCTHAACSQNLPALRDQRLTKITEQHKPLDQEAQLCSGTEFGGRLKCAESRGVNS
jgi:hypothetical protein